MGADEELQFQAAEKSLDQPVVVVRENQAVVYAVLEPLAVVAAAVVVV